MSQFHAYYENFYTLEETTKIQCYCYSYQKPHALQLSVCILHHAYTSAIRISSFSSGITQFLSVPMIQTLNPLCLHPTPQCAQNLTPSPQMSKNNDRVVRITPRTPLLVLSPQVFILRWVVITEVDNVQADKTHTEESTASCSCTISRHGWAMQLNEGLLLQYCCSRYM